MGWADRKGKRVEMGEWSGWGAQGGRGGGGETSSSVLSDLSSVLERDRYSSTCLRALSSICCTALNSARTCAPSAFAARTSSHKSFSTRRCVDGHNKSIPHVFSLDPFAIPSLYSLEFNAREHEALARRRIMLLSHECFVHLHISNHSASSLYSF